MDDTRSSMAAPYWKGDLFICDGRAYADYIPKNEGDIRPVCLGTVEELTPVLSGQPEASSLRPYARQMLGYLKTEPPQALRRAVARAGPPRKPRRPKSAPVRLNQGILPL